MKIRHIVIITIFLLVNIVVIMSLIFGNKKDEDEKENAPFIPTLTAIEVQSSNEYFTVEGYGTVSSFNAVDLACEVQGKLNRGKHPLKPGVKFRKGDLLFRINDTDAQYTLRARKSSFITIIAGLLPDLKVDFPDEFEKWNAYVNSIKLNERLPQLPAWRTAKEKIFLSTRNVLTEYFTIKSTEEQLNKYAIYAPFNGMITTVYTSDLSVVNPGTPVLRIVETDNFEIPVSIPAGEIDAVSIGATVSIFTTSGELKGAGHVVRLSEVIHKNTQSIDVYIKPQSLDGKQFIEGEYVRVTIDEETEHNGVRIPNEAVMQNKVYLFSKSDSLLRLKTVQILNTNDKGVFVTGLKNNTVVITQDVLNYTDTTKYQVLIQ